MSDEQVTLGEDILQNVANSSERLNGDDENRYKESRVYCDTVKAAMDYERQQQEINLNWEKLEFEKHKFEEEMTHKRDLAEADLHMRTEIEQMKTQIEERKAKNEQIVNWVNTGIAGTGMLLTTGLSYLVLKYNMIMGGENGKDAKDIIRTIKNWKIRP